MQNFYSKPALREAQLASESASWATVQLEIWFDNRQRDGETVMPLYQEDGA